MSWCVTLPLKFVLTRRGGGTEAALTPAELDAYLTAAGNGGAASRWADLEFELVGRDVALPGTASYAAGALRFEADAAAWSREALARELRDLSDGLADSLWEGAPGTGGVVPCRADDGAELGVVVFDGARATVEAVCDN
jgi:hypothetical protein